LDNERFADPADADAPTRIILLPSFAKTGQVALLCLETLECKTVEFEVPTWVGEANGHGVGGMKEEGDVKME
jgi:DNA polymerase delta subunit 2